MRRIAVFALAMVAATLIVAQAARATCVVTGEVIRLAESETVTQAYLRPSSLSTVVYYFSSSADNLRESFRAARASGDRVYVIGNAAACPTTGSIRNGGVVVNLITNP